MSEGALQHLPGQHGLGDRGAPLLRNLCLVASHQGWLLPPLQRVATHFFSPWCLTGHGYRPWPAGVARRAQSRGLSAFALLLDDPPTCADPRLRETLPSLPPWISFSPILSHKCGCSIKWVNLQLICGKGQRGISPRAAQRGVRLE